MNGASPQKICGTQISNDEGDPPLGQIDLAYGLELSVNTVYYRLACETGAGADPPRWRTPPASRTRSRSPTRASNKPTAQITLGAGGYEVHVIDQATGYATFAAQGERADPYFVQQVTDSDGNELLHREGQDQPGLHRGHRRRHDLRDAAGGRERHRDAGQAGRPPDGRQDRHHRATTPTPGSPASPRSWPPRCGSGRPSGAPLKGVLGSVNGVYGGTIPAKIFKAFMDAALEGQPVQALPAAGQRRVDRLRPSSDADRRRPRRRRRRPPSATVPAGDAAAGRADRGLADADRVAHPRADSDADRRAADRRSSRARQRRRATEQPGRRRAGGRSLASIASWSAQQSPVGTTSRCSRRTTTRWLRGPSRPSVAHPAGTRGSASGGSGRPLRVLLALTLLTSLLGLAQKAPCRDASSWVNQHQYTHACYSDVLALYSAEGLSRGQVALLRAPGRVPRRHRRGDAGVVAAGARDHHAAPGPADRRPRSATPRRTARVKARRQDQRLAYVAVARPQPALLRRDLAAADDLRAGRHRDDRQAVAGDGTGTRRCSPSRPGC